MWQGAIETLCLVCKWLVKACCAVVSGKKGNIFHKEQTKANIVTGGRVFIIAA